MSKETVGKIEQLTETTVNSLVIRDQEGELLLECEIDDKYHQLIIEVGLNKILEDTLEHLELEDKPEDEEK